MKEPFVSRILKKLAKKAGIAVNLEPKYEFVGQIDTQSGKKRYFRNTNFDLNPLGASEVAKDKDYANYFLKRMGYPTISGRTFYSDEWCDVVKSRRNIHAAYRYARRIGFPVIVKPNSRSQGVGVVKVFTKKEFYRAARFALKKGNVILVQRVVSGKDYRIVVLAREIISAYERLPLTVVGDGRSTIHKLLARKQREFVRAGRDTVLRPDDFRIAMKLKRMRRSFSTVLKKGEWCALLDNANLSTGGDAVDVSRTVHPAWRTWAVKLARDMNLRYIGIDVMARGTLSDSPDRFVVLEVNAAPGLDNYASLGKTQKRIVESLYLKVLEAMARS